VHKYKKGPKKGDTGQQKDDKPFIPNHGAWFHWGF
jgi:hypothetical protein